MWFRNSPKVSKRNPPHEVEWPRPVAESVETPEPEEKPVKLTGVVMRREVFMVSGYKSCSHRLFLAIRLHDGEGLGSKKDTVLFADADLSSGKAALALLQKGDQVTVTLKKTEEGIEVIDLDIDPSLFSVEQKSAD
jgi:hypothetical protein